MKYLNILTLRSNIAAEFEQTARILSCLKTELNREGLVITAEETAATVQDTSHFTASLARDWERTDCLITLVPPSNIDAAFTGLAHVFKFKLVPFTESFYYHQNGRCASNYTSDVSARTIPTVLLSGETRVPYYVKHHAARASDDNTPLLLSVQHRLFVLLLQPTTTYTNGPLTPSAEHTAHQFVVSVLLDTLHFQPFFERDLCWQRNDATSEDGVTAQGSTAELLHRASQYVSKCMQQDDVCVSIDHMYNLLRLAARSMDKLNEMSEFALSVMQNGNSDASLTMKNATIRPIVNASEPHVKQALNIIRECLTEYGPENVFLCFNGGKDCTVLLHLWLSTLRDHFTLDFPKICLYIENRNAFPDIKSFVEDMRQYYDLSIVKHKENIKDSLLVTLREFPGMKSCLMGTRRTDPFSANLNNFQMTDEGWPQIMRCSPILDWQYHQVWDYLLSNNVPYCRLYDVGYTSLGGVNNTIPNPALKIDDQVPGRSAYLPAYKLRDGSLERCGRIPNSNFNNSK